MSKACAPRGHSTSTIQKQYQNLNSLQLSYNNRATKSDLI